MAAMPNMVDTSDSRVFQKMYADALEAWRMFQNYANDMLQSCNENGDDFSAIRANFGLAEEYYRQANKLTAHLRLWHEELLIGKTRAYRTVAEWKQNATIHLLDDKTKNAPAPLTDEQRKRAALIYSLEAMVSALMYQLLNVYGPWRAEADFAEETEEAKR